MSLKTTRVVSVLEIYFIYLRKMICMFSVFIIYSVKFVKDVNIKAHICTVLIKK